MDAVLPAPTASAFDAIASVVSAAVYVVVAGAALASAPRDARVRVFGLIALTAIAPYCASTLLWVRGAGAFGTPVIVCVALSLSIGSVALFHFTQIFPWRRPWIAEHRIWLVLAYAILPPVCAVLGIGLGLMQNSAAGAVSAWMAEGAAIVLLVVVAPAVVILGIVLPFAGLLSLFNTWKAAREGGIDGARLTTWWMLVSQLAGGVLTILVIPLLHVVSVRGPVVSIAAALLFAFGLVMPLAFAAGVWKLNVLSNDPAQPPPSSR